MREKIVFLFPGQGAQYPGMGKEFYDAFAIAKETFQEADDILGYSLSKIVFNGPKETLSQTLYSQPAIYVTSIAILRVLQQQFPELKASATAGLSLGEYTALTAAVVISFADCLPLVAARGKFMQEASEENPSTLAAVMGLSPEEVETHIAELGNLWIANLNCPGQVVIAGSLAAMEKATFYLKEKGAKRVIPLDVSGAFHSGLMKSAQEKLSPFLKRVSLRESAIRIAMNIPGDFVENLEEVRKNLILQVTHTTRWEKAIRRIDQEGIALYIEIGPGKTLCGMNHKIGTRAVSNNIEIPSDLEKIQLAGEVHGTC